MTRQIPQQLPRQTIIRRVDAPKDRRMRVVSTRQVTSATKVWEVENG
jgi:hypothetical protein